jgi:hypothetical protein
LLPPRRVVPRITIPVVRPGRDKGLGGELLLCAYPSNPQAAALLGRAVGRPDDVHGAQGVGSLGLVGTGDQAAHKVLLGCDVAVDVYLVVGRQDYGFSLAAPGRAAPLK